MSLTLTGFIILLIIAAICGSVGQAIAGYSMGGLLASIGVGFIGALLGIWLARQFGLPEFFPLTIDGTSFPVIWSIIGATLFALLISFMRSPRRTTSRRRYR